MEFRLATGNAGTGMYQRGTVEHGCEFVPVADENSMMSKFLVPLAGFMWHPLLTDSAEILSKQAKRQFIIKKNEPLRMVGISHPGKSDVHGMPQNFLLKSFLLLPQSLV